MFGLFFYLSVFGAFQKDENMCGSKRESGAVPQAEGQQRAWLLVEFQMDALQLSCSDQLMRNNGCWTLTLQTVFPTPEKQTRKRKERVEDATKVRKSEIVQLTIWEWLSMKNSYCEGNGWSLAFVCKRKCTDTDFTTPFMEQLPDFADDATISTEKWQQISDKPPYYADS